MDQKNKNNEYGAHSIKVMEGLEAVRKRPGMYIGSTDSKGLHHLVYEVVDNSVDEALAGYCNNIIITLQKNNMCKIEDDGRGIPTDIHETEGISAAEVVLTKLHAGGKFDKETYAFSGGLHGVGVSVVNALSSYLKVTIFRNGKIHEQEFKCGVPVARLKIIGDTNKRGTTIEFLPDSEIFKQTTIFSYDILARRFKEIAFLNKGISIEIKDERSNESVHYKFDKGILSFIDDLSCGKEVIFSEPIYFAYKEKTLEIEIAMQYTTAYDESFVSFVNTINTHEGGTHVAGFKAALTASCNKKAKELKKEDIFTSDDLREGLIAVLNVKIAEPQFEGQTKAKLSNYEIKGIIQSYLSDFFNKYFEENPSVIRKILAKAEMALKAREAARKARELTRKKNGIDNTILPGKLADCSSEDPLINELFIVEGDSAGGSAKTGRDRSIQAILPLRGKILNVEKASLEKMLANGEIKSLVAAIGAGFGNETMHIDDCRYHKIIIMTDADVDGSHIRTLLLTFFFRYMRPIIEKGYLYIAQPPLYKVKVSKQEKYLQNDIELLSLLIDWVYEEITLEVDNHVVSHEIKKNILNDVLFLNILLEKLSNKIGFLIEDLEKFLLELDKNSVPEFILNNDLFIEMSVYINNMLKFNSIVFIFKQKVIGELKSFSILDFCALIRFIAKPFMTIQRYKGLGEMNAEQLWETAMDPEKRQLKKLSVNDFVETESWLVLLMGDEVAPRKNFIEQKAHFVKNLDI
jgi:DNA gyrase subunit B